MKARRVFEHVYLFAQSSTKRKKEQHKNSNIQVQLSLHIHQTSGTPNQQLNAAV